MATVATAPTPPTALAMPYSSRTGHATCFGAETAPSTHRHVWSSSGQDSSANATAGQEASSGSTDTGSGNSAHDARSSVCVDGTLTASCQPPPDSIAHQGAEASSSLPDHRHAGDDFNSSRNACQTQAGLIDHCQRPCEHIGCSTSEEELERVLALYKSQPIERSYVVPPADVTVCGHDFLAYIDRALLDITHTAKLGAKHAQRT
jgi:hypothetical protein